MADVCLPVGNELTQLASNWAACQSMTSARCRACWHVQINSTAGFSPSGFRQLSPVAHPASDGCLETPLCLDSRPGVEPRRSGEALLSQALFATRRLGRSLACPLGDYTRALGCLRHCPAVCNRILTLARILPRAACHGLDHEAVATFAVADG